MLATAVAHEQPGEGMVPRPACWHLNAPLLLIVVGFLELPHFTGEFRKGLDVVFRLAEIGELEQPDREAGCVAQSWSQIFEGAFVA